MTLSSPSPTHTAFYAGHSEPTTLSGVLAVDDFGIGLLAMLWHFLKRNSMNGRISLWMGPESMWVMITSFQEQVDFSLASSHWKHFATPSQAVKHQFMAFTAVSMYSLAPSADPVHRRSQHHIQLLDTWNCDKYLISLQPQTRYSPKVLSDVPLRYCDRSNSRTSPK